MIECGIGRRGRRGLAAGVDDCGAAFGDDAYEIALQPGRVVDALRRRGAVDRVALVGVYPVRALVLRDLAGGFRPGYIFAARLFK